jgi:hypothetical protein
MVLRQRGKTFARLMQLASFPQDRSCKHGVPGFPGRLKSNNFRSADFIQQTWKEMRPFFEIVPSNAASESIPSRRRRTKEPPEQ